MPVPFSFGAATTAIPLSQLDSNFNTPITLGNTAIQLGNTVTTLNNMTLANVTISSGNVTITNVSVTTVNAATVNTTTLVATTANVTTINATDVNVAANVTLNAGTVNGVAYLNGSKVLTTGGALTFDGTNLVVGGGTAVGSTSGGGVTAGLFATRGALTAHQTATGVFQYISDVAAIRVYGSTGVTGQLAFNLGAGGSADSEQMRLNSTGLGIGTSSPSFALDISQAGPRIRQTATTGTNSSLLQLVNTGGTAYVGLDNSSGGLGAAYSLHLFHGGAYPIVFSTSGTERARITSGGNLMVGTTAALISADNRVSVDGTRAIEAKSTGGATAPTSTLWNNATTGDNIFLSFRTEAADTQRGTIDYNRAGGLTRYNTTSDYRAKDIIGPVQNTGATIDALKVYEGKMKGATQSRPMLVAHEAQAVAPYAVSGEKDAVNGDGTPKFQQMDVSSLVPLLLAELQSLRRRVAQLEGTQP